MPPLIVALPVLLVLAMVAGCIWACRREKKDWNNGICAEYGEPWALFDHDSQGGRGYKCRDRVLWVSWPVDKLRAIPARSPGRKLPR